VRAIEKLDQSLLRTTTLRVPNGFQHEKFFALSKNFGENMLHISNNCVQLPTSDIGFRVFQPRSS
jgi:hypothetical protein